MNAPTRDLLVSNLGWWIRETGDLADLLEATGEAAAVEVALHTT